MIQGCYPKYIVTLKCYVCDHEWRAEGHFEDSDPADEWYPTPTFVPAADRDAKCRECFRREYGYLDPPTLFA